MNEPTDECETDEQCIERAVYESDIGERPPSQAVLDAVGAIRDTTPTDLPPLYDVVDPEALDDFCASTGASARPTVTFDYDDLLVTVHGTESIAIAE